MYLSAKLTRLDMDGRRLAVVASFPHLDLLSWSGSSIQDIPHSDRKTFDLHLKI